MTLNAAPNAYLQLFILTFMKAVLKFALFILAVFSASCKVSQYTSLIPKKRFYFCLQSRSLHGLPDADGRRN